MYQHSFRAEGPYQGEFETAQQALDAGRGMYGDVTRVWVGKMEQAHFSDMFIGAAALLAYMREVAEEHGDSFVDAFDNLPGAFRNSLGEYVQYAIGEWEGDLPEEHQFTGMIVKQFKGYKQSDMVRAKDFT